MVSEGANPTHTGAAGANLLPQPFSSPTTDYLAIAQQHVADLYPLIVYAKPTLAELPAGSILGSWCYSVPNKVRFILAKDLEVAPGVLPADLTRAWVKDEYELPIRRRKIQMEKHYSAPLHARLGNHGECSYIDIQGAYLQILALGYDLEYRRGKYLCCNPRPVPKQIAKNKFSYSIAVAMSGPKLSSITIKGNDTIFTHRPFNMFSNPCLFSLAVETLSGIGSEMLSVLGQHCKYINTDGYIIDRRYEKVALDIVRTWGFNARVKYTGDTTVRGVASWKIGEDETTRHNVNAQDFTSVMMTRDERRWLKLRWSKWSSYLGK